MKTSYWSGNVTIGGRQYPRFLAAPLDGVTDSPFRRLVRQFSADNLLYTEMRHVLCVAHDVGGKKALNFSQLERPLQFQMTTNTVDEIERAVQRVLEIGVDGIDLNIACPARNVVKSQSGSAVMANLPLLKQVLTILRSAVPLPLTVKMRAGFKEKNALDVVQLVQDCGVDALAIHPRLQTEQFAGPLDYALVASIKNSVSIPVLYSGGITSFADAQQVYDATGVDGFLIGRALRGAPWLLAELAAHAQGQEFVVTKKMVIDSALTHFDLLCQYYGRDGLYMFRKFLPFYIKDGTHASAVRQRLMVCHDAAEIRRGLQEFLGDQ